MYQVGALVRESSLSEISHIMVLASSNVTQLVPDEACAALFSSVLNAGEC